MQNSFIQPGNLYYFGEVGTKVTVYLACMSIEHGDTTSSLLKVEIYKLIKVYHNLRLLMEESDVNKFY